MPSSSPGEYGLMGLAAIALGKYMWRQIIALGNMISKNNPPPQQPAIQLLEEIKALAMNYLEENAKKKRDATKIQAIIHVWAWFTSDGAGSIQSGSNSLSEE